tara:strand:+ start:63 stop:338 length:276 start_codon:yes stop_codon:yes gene_type:complete
MIPNNQRLQRIIKEELVTSQLEILKENPALLTKFVPAIQKIAPQIQKLGPALETYGPVITQLISMVQGLDDEKLQQVMALVSSVSQLGDED